MILREDYISIVIPVFNRFHYFKEVIESIYEFADYPFEIIVHDDASSDGTAEKIYEIRDKISTLIVNSNKGWNMGLAESIDRATGLATSNYIIMLNADSKIVRPCFLDIKNVLDKPYVGFISLHENNDFSEFFKSNNTEFIIQGGLGSGCTLAYRKDVWENVSGFAGHSGMWSGGADTHFINAVWKIGYFRAALNGAQPVYNMSLLDNSNKDTTINGSVNDCSLPRIFSRGGNFDFVNESKNRYGSIDSYKHSIEHVAYERNNSAFWHEFTTEFINFPNIDWDKQISHSRWKSLIAEEILYKKGGNYVG